jgi:hypothetical protein
VPDINGSVTPSSSSSGPFAWLWDHRKAIAPFIGVALAILCPHLGVVAGPCKLVGEVVRTWSYNGSALP